MKSLRSFDYSDIAVQGSNFKDEISHVIRNDIAAQSSNLKDEIFHVIRNDIAVQRKFKLQRWNLSDRSTIVI